MQKIFVTNSANETEEFAEKIGKNLHGGETIELTSDVGGGKTTFTRGLVRGAGSKDHASSPSFTISNEYKTPNFVMHHFDFYRLHEPGVIAHELHEKLHDETDVVVVEWSDIVEHVLPKKRLRISIAATGETSRTITAEFPDDMQTLLKGITA